MSDTNAILRQLPIIVGSLGGTLLLVNRLLTDNLTAWQVRSDVLGAIVCAVLILTGLLWQRVQPKPPDSVMLRGEEGLELDPELPETVQRELAWSSQLLLTNTVTKTLVVWHQGRVLMRRGILVGQTTVELGAIAQRAIQTQKPIYLVKLDLYPGRVEFNYLPVNTQGVICQPIGAEGLMILGANAPRSYSKQDETWIAGLAEKLADTLRREL